MLNALEIALVVTALVLFVPSAVLFLECLLALGGKQRTGGKARADVGGPRAAIVIPAHDEEASIAHTVGNLLPELGAADRVLVVADNCTDETALRARAAGANVVERNDPTRRGKGYAISFAIDTLATNPPDVVIVIDADCNVAPGSLRELVQAATSSNRPIQADYLLEAPSDAGPGSAVSAFAILVRNRVRPRGLSRLGLPCQLTGSGMAFPWRVLKAAAPTNGSVVEDLVMGIDLALRGHAPRYLATAKVRSVLPSSKPAAVTQRQRWESGQLATLVHHAPRLLARGLVERRAELIALALDLAVPPLALLVSMLLGTCAVSLVAWLGGSSPLAAQIVLIDLLLVGVAVCVAWLGFGRETLSFKNALTIPAYMVVKIRIYVSLLIHGRPRTWVRTERG